jgi:hypothetical protein
MNSNIFVDCNVGDSGAQVIAEALKVNDNLTSLGLCGL